MNIKVLLSSIVLMLCIQVSIAQELDFYTNWDEAKEIAAKENKNILVVLTGSEWCRPCKIMDKKVFGNPLFQEYAKENLVMFIVDLPGGKIFINSKVYQDYTSFQNKYDSKALPSLILTDKDGVKIKTLKGKMYKINNVLKQLKNA